MKSKRKFPENSNLYLILDVPSLGGKDCRGVTRQALAGGVRIVQLRDKTASSRCLLALAEKIKPIIRRYRGIFIINDRVDIAAACDADGVHLGQDDIPLKCARKILGRARIIGISCHNLKEIRKARDGGADYVAVGPVFATPAKPHAVPAGLRLVEGAARGTGIPWVAVGGINSANVGRVIEHGAKRVAVIRAIVSARDVKRAARKLNDTIRTSLENI